MRDTAPALRPALLNAALVPLTALSAPALEAVTIRSHFSAACARATLSLRRRSPMLCARVLDHAEWTKWCSHPFNSVYSSPPPSSLWHRSSLVSVPSFYMFLHVPSCSS